MENIRIVFISIPQDEAKNFARGLVEERMAACVNLIPKIESFFWWEDQVQADDESLLLVKTTQLKLDKLMEYVKDNHPYDIPEAITVQVAEGLPDYINWVIEEMGKEA